MNSRRLKNCINDDIRRGTYDVYCRMYSRNCQKRRGGSIVNAYINQILKLLSTYWQEINRIVFKFYIGIDSSDDEYNLDMFMYCYYEAIDLLKILPYP